MIEEITKLRIETLGTSFIYQHSDARIWEHLISKWHHSKEVAYKVLLETYSAMERNGYSVSIDAMKKDIDLLFSQNAQQLIRN